MADRDRAAEHERLGVTPTADDGTRLTTPRWEEADRPHRAAADPGATRTAMRAQAMPGEDPETLPHPSEIAARIVPMAAPDLTRTGQIYQAKHDRWVSYQQPA